MFIVISVENLTLDQIISIIGIGIMKGGKVTYQFLTVCQSLKLPPVAWAPHSTMWPARLKYKPHDHK